MNAPASPLCRYLQHFQPPGGTWRRWQRAEPALLGRDLASLRVLLLDRDCAPQLKDTVLGALVRIGQTPELLPADARFALLACLLPGLQRIAGSYRDALGDEDVWAELGLAAWQMLERYDLDRRPRRIAANVLWDTNAHVLKAVRRERKWERTLELNDSTVVVFTQAGSTPSFQGLGDAVDAGFLLQVDATLIEATRLNGLRLDEAAALLGISYEAAKKRRRRAELAWVSWWAPERQVLNAMPGWPKAKAA